MCDFSYAMKRDELFLIFIVFDDDCIFFEVFDFFCRKGEFFFE